MKYPNYKILLFSFFLISLTNCKKETQQAEILNKDNQESQKILKSDIDIIKYTDYILSDQSVKVTADWVKFLELQDEIEKLKKGELTFFRDDIVLIKTLTKELKEAIPESLNKHVITTRITVLENNLYNLHSELNLKRPTKNYTLKSIKALLISASNLKLQINKQLEMDSQNIIKPQ